MSDIPTSANKIKTFFQKFVLACILIAFLFKVVIPAGFMPDTDTGGSFKMVICTMSGPQTILVDKNFDPQKPNDHQERDDKKNSLCDFSVNTIFAEADYGSAMSAEVSFSRTPTLPPTDGNLTSARFFGNSSSRAPPILSYA